MSVFSFDQKDLLRILTKWKKIEILHKQNWIWWFRSFDEKRLGKQFPTYNTIGLMWSGDYCMLRWACCEVVARVIGGIPVGTQTLKW